MKDKRHYIQEEQKRIAGMVTRKFKAYYLTGGTALAFHFDHRFSEDLDFFSQEYRKEVPSVIMDFISTETGFSYELEREQNDPRLVPMKIYYLELKGNCLLKIDFVQDFQKNRNPIHCGVHSVEDIYFRKFLAAMGVEQKESITGRVISGGRQAAKDLFDIYYLSKNFRPVSDFFLACFPPEKAEGLIAWYRGFNQTELKLELLDLVEGVDSGEVRHHLEGEILRKLPLGLMG